MERKKALDRKAMILYLWIGLAFLSLWTIHSLVNYWDTFFPRLLDNSWRTVYVIVFNFIFFEYTVPFVLQKRRYLIYNILLGIFLLWAHLMLWSFGLYGWRALGIAIGVYTPFVVPEEAREEHMVTVQMSFSAASVVFFGTIRSIYKYFKLKQATQALQIEKQKAELNYLKSQTNPHFLFNTLNNIYALTKDKSSLAPESILRLSKILRFMLYEAGGEFIPVEQELKIIGDYISLEQLRYDESLRVNFNYDVEDMKQALPPLLLIPLVENAFKHGVSETRGEPFIDIHLSIRNRQLMFIVKNSAETSYEEAGLREKIGLSNLRRQLELLYRDYELNVKNENAVFTASLRINLASHV